MKKVIGIIKKEGDNKGRLFSCLQTADGKTVPKTYKLLDTTLSELADLRSGIKKMSEGVKKYWHAWFTKEDNAMILGSYEETIESEEGEVIDSVQIKNTFLLVLQLSFHNL